MNYTEQDREDWVIAAAARKMAREWKDGRHKVWRIEFEEDMVDFLALVRENTT